MKKDERSPKRIMQTVLLVLLPILILLALLRNIAILRQSHEAERNADHTPPTIFLTRDNRYFVEPGEIYEEEGYAAYDDIDGDITKSVEVSVSDDTVQYKVKDSAGNITIRYRKIPYAEEEEETGTE